MTDGWALPESLRGTFFTAAQASAAGVGARRLRGDRVASLHLGIWADAEAKLGIRDRARAALLAVGDDAWISHASAAQLHGMWLPPRLRELDRIDVTVAAPLHAPRGAGIRGRQRDLDEACIEIVDGIRVTAPAQSFVDGVDYLAVDDLVALGESVLNDREPMAGRGAVLAAIDAHRGRRGHRRLVAAARLVSPRARSRSETIARLELRALGAPPAWWNVPVVLGDVELAPDAAFWPAGVVIEVEGEQHRVDRAQWLTDIDRYNRYQRLGLEPHRLIVTSRGETRERLRPILERIRQRWDASRPTPRIAPWFRRSATVDEGWLLDSD